jgi:hypothetical protein
MQTQIARAEAIYLAKRWRDARTEYAGLLPKLTGTDRERAVLRAAQCDVQMGGRVEVLDEVPLTDPDLTAERWFTIGQIYGSQKLDPQMMGACGRVLPPHARSFLRREERTNSHVAGCVDGLHGEKA